MRETRCNGDFLRHRYRRDGALRALQESSLRVPEDVSVIGFDDNPTAAFLIPPLTTVRVERAELGMLAVRRLVERAANPQLTPMRVELVCRLIERQSVARVSE
ncbi:MAG: substrate-binding domain-containing protein [Blastochloris sp.]|nr:substrate-binding domain-containing protein [Blastochloris sp.]